MEEEAPDWCRAYYVEGAGHAGALDDRCDLRALMADWGWRELAASRVVEREGELQAAEPPSPER